MVEFAQANGFNIEFENKPKKDDGRIDRSKYLDENGKLTKVSKYF